MISLENFFKPQSVVIIGVSRTPQKVGHVLFRNLLDGGYKGKVFLVNKNTQTILNYDCYPSVLAIPEQVDLAIIAVPAEFVLQTLKECNKKNIKDILIITSGFAEVGNEKLEKQLKEYIIKNKMRMVGPNCLGILDAYNRFDSLFLPRYRLKRPVAGGISFVCQSGAVGSTILDLASEQGHKFSKFISYGNATTLDESDFIQYLGEDPTTKVICLYVEGIRDGRKFMKVLQEVVKKKPVIAIKGGITEEGTKAALSHTGSLAGNADVYFGIFKQLGIIHAKSLQEMLHFATIFERGIIPHGNRVQIITNGGGYGILSTDALVAHPALSLAKLENKTIIRLKQHLSPLVNIRNPLDLVGSADTAAYQTALECCLQDKNVDIILLIVLYQTPLVTTDIVDVIIEFSKMKQKPIVVVSTGGEFTEVLRRSLDQNNLVTYTFPEDAVHSLSALVEYYLKK